MIKREAYYFAYYDKDSFTEECKKQIDRGCNTYNAYFSGEPYKITDINKVVNNKQEWYNNRINLYYDNNKTVFLAIFLKTKVLVEVLILDDVKDFKVNNFVYGLGKQLKSMIKEKVKEDPVW